MRTPGGMEGPNGAPEGVVSAGAHETSAEPVADRPDELTQAIERTAGHMRNGEYWDAVRVSGDRLLADRSGVDAARHQELAALHETASEQNQSRSQAA